jgi:DNA helicase-2/ATP-dependent DNA helicase PcrA
MNDKERALEIEHLASIVTEIHTQLSLANSSHTTLQTELNKSLTDYWEDSTTDFWQEAQFIETVARQRSIATASYRRYLQLQKLLASPYFGRIDFIEAQPSPAATAEPLYIGLATLSDQASKAILIYDWRSPIAGMFYDFERGPARYQSPIGPISGLITLKRQFKIVDGHMEYLFDSDLKIDDEILQEILSKSADSKMRTIITSIQREQNQAIRDEQHRILFVQGPAGSGKTSIAMHRAAYLLYRERNTLTAKNILIFSPNRIFSDYISNVLPELGEENVQQTVFQDYLITVLADLPFEIEERDTQLEYLYGRTEESDYRRRIASIHYKSAPAFTKLLTNYLHRIQNDIQNNPDLVFNGETIFTHQEWSTVLNSLSYLPIAKRLAQLKRLIQVRLRPLIHQLRDDEAIKIAARGEEVNERVIKALARLAVKEQLTGFITDLNSRTVLDPLVLYRRLFEDRNLFNQLAESTEVPAAWEDIRHLTLTNFDQGKILYEDSLPLLFLQGCLMGFPSRNDIRHLVIDEAQDYTLLQYQILKRIFPKSSWTILGDPAQAIHPYLQTADFEAAANILSNQTTAVVVSRIIRLTQSYRSTSEIQAFARQLLANPESTEQIQRLGSLPQIIRVAAPQTLCVTIAATIAQLQAEGWKSIAVICKTLAEATNAFKELSHLTEISLLTPETIEFRRGVVVIPAYLAKGLEFDAVLVYNVSNDAYGSAPERNILYTVCTRALHRLLLYYTGTLSCLVEEVSAESYQHQNG